MTLDNFVKSLTLQQNRRPFLQYEIELTSGSVLRVNHPDALAFMGRRAILMTSDGTTHEFDNESVAQITKTDLPAEKEGPAIKTAS